MNDLTDSDWKYLLQYDPDAVTLMDGSMLATGPLPPTVEKVARLSERERGKVVEVLRWKRFEGMEYTNQKGE